MTINKNKLLLIKKHFWKVTTTVLLIGLFCLLFVPTFSLSVGNIFFGGVSPLYNVKMAQYLYFNASYPMLPIAPPNYAHHQLSRTYFIQGNLNKALEEAETELKVHSNNTRTYYILGLTLGYLHKEKEAIEAFSTFIENFPDTWAGRNDKAWLQFRIGDIDGALETIEPIVEYSTWNVWVQNTYCALLINKKDYIKARRACEYAKEAVDKMTETDWGQAYPGNDLRVYGAGLNATKTSIDENLKLLEGR